ncbi:hypothetical protein KP509_39G003900 [Ceratopteris richardii]|nr:hypothetical protein KP509_39G003900 [Ceratopteris richardii]KAH7276353.1 hypothetical protein KP509_39G003900 [Ceratopteris richardii]KAH7276355.1 hypothetical protein KP509_39G003900 [Ceratopteris richardii]
MLPSSLSCASFAGENVRQALDANSRIWVLQPTTIHMIQKRVNTFCSMFNNEATPMRNDQGAQQPAPLQPAPQQQPMRNYNDPYSNPYQLRSSVRRRPYNLEAKMRMKQYRREAMMLRRQQELEEEQRTFQLDYTTIYQKGHPGTVQGVIKEIIHLGYIVTLPNGREGLLAASHLGCSGGIPLLERLFKVGQEITIRVIPVPNPAGKDRVYIRP